ncbi:globin domain-containing protein [Thalassiella azotivora]
MDPAALKASWKVVAEYGGEVPLFFYSHLFLSHPEVRPLFPVSMTTQRDRLVGALGRIVGDVDRLEEVTPFIQQLGRDHRRFDVVTQHYDAVGASLLATLEHFLADRWTDELAADWAAAYGVIAKVMVEAATESEATSPAAWDAEVVIMQRRTIDTTVLRVRPELPFPYRAGQSVAVQVPQRPRQWRYLSPANAPREDNTIDLHVQLVPGGQVSGAIVRRLAVGDRIRLGAPLGHLLTVPDDHARPLLLVAGGTGLAPMRALVDQLERRWGDDEQAPRVHLFHGARTEWALYDREQLDALAQRPWFTWTGVLSEEPSRTRETGLVGDVVAAAGPWDGHRVLVCGSEGMTRHTVSRLVDSGVAPDDVRHEDFSGTTDRSPAGAAARSTEGPGDAQ